jgi:DNA-directed RNA polymerase subunit beta
MTQTTHIVKRGNTERLSFGKIKNVIDIPYLIEVQKSSYENFIATGVQEVFDDYSPIIDIGNKFSLEFLSYKVDGECKYSLQECKERDQTYTIPMKAKVRLTNNATGEMKESEVFMGDFPRMTDNGTFVINGAERVVVSQLVRSPGVYTGKGKLDKHGKERFDTQIIPSRGAWLEFQQDANDVLSVRVDRARKISSTIFLKALGFDSNEDIKELFDNDPMILKTLEKDGNIDNSASAKREAFFKIKPGEQETEAGVENLLKNLLFERRRYDLAKVGRYKFNKHLSLANRISGKIAANNIVSPDGEVLVEAGQEISKEMAKIIQNAPINAVLIKVDENRTTKVIGNSTVDIRMFVEDFDPVEIGVSNGIVYYPVLKDILEKHTDSKEKLHEALKENAHLLVVRTITLEDIIATISYNLNMRYGLYVADNIDHLSNRRVRSVGELLQNQLRVGMSRLERVVRERMLSQDPDEATPASLINIRPVSSALREFFGSSQLSQFMDQPNPIAELTHKRKLSALGPGGLNRERAGMEVRDVHHSHYGRMCPIETPEGQNIGLITSLSSYARINEYGFIEAPYRKIDKKTGVVTDKVEYMTADEEDNYYIVQANEPLDENQRLINERVTCRFLDRVIEVGRDEVDYMDVNPQQLVSIATSLIPFLENDDANRALMGSNMQRQAVPLIRPEAPIVGTGMEHKVALDSGVCVIAQEDGVVTYVSADFIAVENKDGEKEYQLEKFARSNQGTCLNQKPNVNVGDKVKKGQIIADGPSVDNGELALGRNVLVGFMSWEGFNYEDSILISEDLVKDDVFTSIHIEKHEIESRTVAAKLGEEEITRDIPNVSEELLKNLDEYGIVRVGAEVRAGDYLVGKVAPKGETELTPEQKLLRAIFGDKAREVRDASLKVPNGAGGIVVDVKVFTRANKDELPPGVNQLVRVYLAQKRKIGVGDKMAGRHGNKGVISRVLPKEDMPFLEDGTPLDIVLNPLGVPSRMNLGQVLEVHLGLVANKMGVKVATPVFDGATENDIKDLFIKHGITHKDENGNEYVDGKVKVYDGRTGEVFENAATVGYMYMLKLNHLVDDKIHARSVGPYSLVTQQPLGGKAQFGGQRFGEMEVWALEAYGAANILQELVTIKSDDVMGRQKAYNSIVKSTGEASPGLPESFKVLRKELQSLCLDVKLLTGDSEEVQYSDIDDDSDDIMIRPYTDIKDADFDVLSLDDINSDNLFVGGEHDMKTFLGDSDIEAGTGTLDLNMDNLIFDDPLEEDDDIFGEPPIDLMDLENTKSDFDDSKSDWIKEEMKKLEELEAKQKETNKDSSNEDDEDKE